MRIECATPNLCVEGLIRASVRADVMYPLEWETASSGNRPRASQTFRLSSFFKLARYPEDPGRVVYSKETGQRLELTVFKLSAIAREPTLVE
jgi:hypothetical protein